jgi:hypothetical protein
MPLWQDAPRGEGAATGLGAAAGLTGVANGTCAKAADEIVEIAAIVAIEIRSPDQGAGIDVTGSHAKLEASSNI